MTPTSECVEEVGLLGGLRAGSRGPDADCHLQSDRRGVQIDVECRQSDLELLFVDWLDAVIYEMATRKMLFGCFVVRIEGLALRGSLWSEPVDVCGTHQLANRRVPRSRY